MISKYGSKRGEKRIRLRRNKHKDENIKDEDSTKTLAPNSDDKTEKHSWWSWKEWA